MNDFGLDIDFDDVLSRAADMLDPQDQRWKPLPHQVPPPGHWFAWMLMGGRGAGKTATAAKYVHDLVHGPPMIEGVPGGHWISIVGPTLGDAVTSCVYGPSGLRKWDPGIKVTQQAGGTICRWSNGVEAKLFGAHQPEDVERFRAGGNRTFVWLEEFAAWRYMDEAWQQIRYGLRSGLWPHCLITTTPRNRIILKDMVKKAKISVSLGEKNPEYVITQATTKDNPHLDTRVKDMLFADYEGTRMGRQELYGEIVEDVEGALWTTDMIERNRLVIAQYPQNLSQIVVGVDPQGSQGSTETGIVVCGRENLWRDGDDRPHGFVLADYSIDGTPDEWASAAVEAALDYEADYIVAEVTHGHDMVSAQIKNIEPTMKVVEVHATRGKARRAGPVSQLYEQDRIHHVGLFPELEEQQTTWDAVDPDPSWSPDRMDALVWALTNLLVSPKRIVKKQAQQNTRHRRRR